MFFKNRKGQFFPYADSAPRKSFPIIALSLIVINVAIFIWTYFLNYDIFDHIIFTYGFTPASPTILTLLTSMFLHGGPDHIFGNMWYLWIFGDNVEDRFGKIGFVVLYFLSGLFATFMQYLTDPVSDIPSIGASGAISGVLGGYILLFPKAGVLTGYGHLPAFIVIGLWFFIQFIFGTASLLGGIGSNIAFFAHIGGFVFGAILTFILLRIRKI